MNSTRYGFQPLLNFLPLSGYEDWLYNLDVRAPLLGDVVFSQSSNITPLFQTQLFNGNVSQGFIIVDLTNVV